MEKLAGISKKRRLPAFARQPFTAWFKQHRPVVAPIRGQVVLFNDTFNTYNSPEVAIAATEVLEAIGFEVVLSGHRCCGRPMISKGLVEEARAAARETINRLAPFAERGLPIVGLEPSCLLSLRDEYLALFPGDPKARIVADRAVLFDSFIAQLADKGQLDGVFASGSRRALLHGHCHQKALVGTDPTKKALASAGCSVEEVDSGCCGMAGSFGYEAEHYDISLQMAERRLLPAVRAASQDTVIVAPGFSCRHQIADGTARHALHPAQVLQQSLRNGKIADQ
jgi:Fe-S oxidoreductase